MAYEEVAISVGIIAGLFMPVAAAVLRYVVLIERRLTRIETAMNGFITKANERRK